VGFSFARPATSTLGTRRVCDDLPWLRQGIFGPRWLADVDVIATLAVAGVPQLTRRLLTGTRAHHSAHQYGRRRPR
jgi:hypothetical protein